MSHGVDSHSGPPPKKLKAEVKKLEGMQRELYSLMGENTPPVLASAHKFKSTPDWRQKVTPWTWAPFTNKRAREGDGLELHHWVRGVVSQEEGESAPYRFAEFSTGIDLPEWEDKDYEHFKRDDWSLEETKYLFELAKHYSLKWFVMHDRFDAEKGGKDRSLEDLKQRFYEVCTAVIKTRAGGHLSPTDEELIEHMKYDKEAEEKRKAHLERLQSRSPTEVAEEEALVLEAKRLESLAERMLVERRQIVQLLESPASEGAIGQFQTSQGVAQLQQELLNTKSRKIQNPAGPSTVRKSLTVTQPMPASATATATSANGSTSTSGAAAKTAETIRKRFSAKEEAAYGISYHERQSAGVYLRSSKIPALKQSIQARATAIFNELGLPIRPVMPTAKVCAKHDQVQQQVTLLLEAKRVQDKLQAEIDVLKHTKK